MTDLGGLQRTWETLAQTDPLWAICTDPGKKGRQWNTEEFFATGEKEIGAVLEHLARLGLVVRMDGTAMDFGCGVGRLTRALCRTFSQCVGVDISPTMISLAQDHNQYGKRCEYVLNDCDNLGRFRDGSFTFIYSSIVLQHMAPEFMKCYLREFARVLAPTGILVCQIPDCYWSLLRGVRLLRQRLALRTRLRRLVGMTLPEPVPATTEMEMHWLREREVRRALMTSGCRVVEVRLTNSIEPDFDGKLVFLAGGAAKGIVSKQYCAVKGEIT